MKIRSRYEHLCECRFRIMGVHTWTSIFFREWLIETHNQTHKTYHLQNFLNIVPEFSNGSVNMRCSQLQAGNSVLKNNRLNTQRECEIKPTCRYIFQCCRSHWYRITNSYKCMMRLNLKKLNMLRFFSSVMPRRLMINTFLQFPMCQWKQCRCPDRMFQEGYRHV